MSAIVIKTRNRKNLKLLTDLAEQLGETVNKLTRAEAEDIQLGMIMKTEKTGKTVSKKSVFKYLDAK